MSQGGESRLGAETVALEDRREITSRRPFWKKHVDDHRFARAHLVNERDRRERLYELVGSMLNLTVDAFETRPNGEYAGARDETRGFQLCGR